MLSRILSAWLLCLALAVPAFAAERLIGAREWSGLSRQEQTQTVEAAKKRLTKHGVPVKKSADALAESMRTTLAEREDLRSWEFQEVFMLVVTREEPAAKKAIESSMGAAG